MFSGKPVVYQVTWISLVIQLVVLQVIIFCLSFFVEPYSSAVNIGIILYLFLFLLVRCLVPRNHRKGMRFVKKEDYVRAVEEFEKSYDFFTKYAWIDKYRYFVLLSHSSMCYKEMALVNIAYCYTQCGDGNRAREYYVETLRQFPDNEMAKSALRMLDSVSPYADW